jgi:hypothetical protein
MTLRRIDYIVVIVSSAWNIIFVESVLDHYRCLFRGREREFLDIWPTIGISLFWLMDNLGEVPPTNWNVAMWRFEHRVFNRLSRFLVRNGRDVHGACTPRAKLITVLVMLSDVWCSHLTKALTITCVGAVSETGTSSFGALIVKVSGLRRFGDGILKESMSLRYVHFGTDKFM